MSSTKVNVLSPNSGLQFEPSADSRAQFNNYDDRFWLPTIAALLSGLIGVMGATFKAAAVTFTLDTNAYAAGDLLADTQAIANAIRVEGLVSKLTGFTLVDKDDQTAAGIDVVFLRSNTSMGTENAAPSISDALAGTEILGVISVASGDWIDIGGSKIATKTLSVPLECVATAGTSIYVALIARGTPTQTASGIVGTFNFRQE